MSEIKRVALNSFEPPKVSDSASKNISKTLRITVTLPESNEDKCPEYNYKDLLALTKKRSKSSKEVNGIEQNGLDLFADNDDDVKRIAMEMEAKYGLAATGKKKYKGRRDDYADIGLGYDESDSFIDNTDGYDEIIPQNVTTLHGGFYINCGALEFKTDDEASPGEESSLSDTEDEENGVRSVKRKRVIESSDEDSEDVGAADTSVGEKKPKLPKNNMQLAIKKQLFSQNKIQVKKRRPINPLKKTVKELLKEKRVEPDTVVIPPLTNPDETAEKQKEIKSTASIISVPLEEDYDKNQNKQNTSDGKEHINRLSTEPLPQVEGESSQDAMKAEIRELVLLPENLDADILEIVNKIKQRAIDYKGEGKIKFFSEDVNVLLLSLERKCKNLGKASRVKVYEHLSYFIKCKRETLIRRAKILLIADDEKRLEKVTKKFKDIIDQTMPPLLAHYEKESAIVLQKKFSDNEENKNLKLPRRRFQWSEDGKKLLKELMGIKRRICLLEGKQKDNLEEQIVKFMKTTLVPLWPDGWMYLNNLKKVYNSTIEAKLSNKKSPSATHSNLSVNTSVKEECSKVEGISSSLVKNATVKISKSPKTSNNNTSKAYSECFKEKHPVNMFLKKNEITESQMDNSFAELLKSIQSDFKKPQKSNKQIEDSPQVENKSREHTEHKDKAKNFPDHKDKFRDFADHKDKAIPSDLSKTKHSEKPHNYSKHKNDEKISKMQTIATDMANTMNQSQLINLSNRPDTLYTRPVQNDVKKHIEKIAEPVKFSNHIETINTIGQTEIIKLPSDSSVIVVNTHQNKGSQIISKNNPASSKSKDIDCQLLDLTEKNKNRLFPFNSDEPKKESSTPAVFPITPDLFGSPAFFEETKKETIPSPISTGDKADDDDVQLVMKNLKALHKLSSSMMKADNSSGAPVSVIAFNKNFSSKSNSGSNIQHDKGDSSSGFQDEFQKQFINSLQNAANSSNSSNKSNYKCS